ncbi:type VI secretion system baseplate subunit TssF [Desulfogranum mediterraneum]|uniref:type VI secretion system baseplate subunit TssF n=1 Tax=Desulfogranum mediterraneum TaxID=160661 RepID=UPI00041A0F16|nr:type VI secretion system baseplate subunit TssF [Desulfogranum mediterraneum]
MDVYSKYYEQELYNLRQLAREFAEVHPAIAPMLSGQAADPDVERLLEGTAFLSGLLRQKIDDHLPEVIHSLTNFIFPHFLKSIPAVSLVRFTPKKGLQEPLLIQAGTELGANRVDQVSATFKTCFDCTVQPLAITRISNSGSAAGGQQITVEFRLSGPGLDTWIPEKLAFYIGGSYSRAADLFYLLTRKLRRIVAESEEGGKGISLAAQSLQPTAFERKNSLLPYPGNSFPGFRYLQEYFLLPHKFLFLELRGLGEWTDRGTGTGFRLCFELEPSTLTLPNLGLDALLLSTVPVINLFSHEADPILQDHSRDKIMVSPALKEGRRPEIYSVDRVTGYTRGAMVKKEYHSASLFGAGRVGNSYGLLHSISKVSNRPELSLQFSYPPEELELAEETISVSLTCTNGDIPQQLKLGDVCRPTSQTPELVEFSNLMKPTLSIDPPLSGSLLWKLLSHLSLNLLSLSTVENLTELLELYVFKQDRDQGRVASNLKRIQGIEEFEVTPTNRLIRGQMMRGQKIRLTARSDHFAGTGDFCLFGMVLDQLFSEYCSMNTFIQLDIIDSVSGETYPWPTRVGNKTLI